jgi:4-hydroxy-4-methyl-2-oxoglutarate aldolase
MFTRNPHPQPTAPDVVRALMSVQTSTLGHMRDYGFPRGLTPIARPLKFVGCAITVRLPHLDSTALHVAADSLRPGDVIVVEQSGDERSCFGGMVAFTAHARGAVGAVIAGAANDYDELIELGLPVFSAGFSSRTTRILGIEGAINVPVTVGGVVVQPGDVVFGDSDGVAILKPDEALELAAQLEAKEAKEPERQRRIAAGEHLSDFTNAADLFRALETGRTATASPLHSVSASL